MKTRSVRNFLLAAAAAVGLLAQAASAGVIYLAPEASSLYANNQIGFAPCCGPVPGGVISGPFGVGNTITFAQNPVFGDVTVDLFGYAGGGSKSIEVDLYAGTNPNTGTLIGSEQITPTGNGWTTEHLDFGALQLPQTLTYIVSIVGNNGSYDDSFVDWQQFTGNTGSPTIGTSGDMWYGAPGSFVVDNSYAVATGAKSNTLGVEFYVPEPLTVSLFGGGLLGLGALRWRKKKTA